MSSLIVKKNTVENWLKTNPILQESEVGLEIDTFRYKIGDGVTRWHNLDYSGNSGIDNSEDTTRVSVRKNTLENFLRDNIILRVDEIGLETDTFKYKYGDGTTDYANLNYAVPLLNLYYNEYDNITPASTVTDATSFGMSSNVGTSLEYSRGDHSHGTPNLPQDLDTTGHPQFAYVGLGITPNVSYSLNTFGSINVGSGNLIVPSGSSGVLPITFRRADTSIGYEGIYSLGSGIGFLANSVLSVSVYSSGLVTKKLMIDTDMWNSDINLYEKSNGLAIQTNTTDRFTITSGGDISVNTGEFNVSSTKAIHFGDTTTDGTWRIIRNGNNLEIQLCESGSYVAKTIITP